MNSNFSNQELSIINQALDILKSKARTSDSITSPEMAKALFKTQIETSEREVFCVALLDNQHRLIESVELFKGTIDAASVYPREVVKLVLDSSAAAVVFAHNHPSGIVDPSQADKLITNKLKSALDLIDVRVLDHIIVGSEGSYSFAERGLI
ncbi:DNA repair protein RadC [Pseudoalteromonas sp. Of11M-6]|uniref:RadC family protein n=1 Tax=Pseudoalteromonas sp. Of11M-6 TaxID=2917754 RepID=UPI001EF4FA7D|nr:DNA repair protein RadC [Pseudoalteromonas sp. Of11M-6]MCG7556335.1 DNA repair protein RadC [Pseudoalteromonas sp. Of11M-6]